MTKPLLFCTFHHCIYGLRMLNMQSSYINSPEFANKASQHTNLIFSTVPFNAAQGLYRLKGKGAKTFKWLGEKLYKAKSQKTNKNPEIIKLERNQKEK